jgi:FSR family fosmidomycin resistance protein-like MFS transporter
MFPSIPLRRWRGLASFAFMLLVVEFLDEFVFGARETAWPLIHSDLHLTYEQIGVLLSVPIFTANLIEPVVGILGDVWKRRLLILGSGVAFMIELILFAVGNSFGMLLVAFIVLYPASGGFVGLSQASLMDTEPDRHEHNMARWNLAGTVGVIAGSLLIGALAASGMSWRWLFLLAALMTGVVLIRLRGYTFGNVNSENPEPSLKMLKEGFLNSLRALRRIEVLRWLILLQFADLMLDVLHGYLALYFVDVAGLSQAEASLAVTLWIGAGLLGDVLLIPLLEKIRGLSYLRISTAFVLVLFPIFLLIPGIVPKLIILAVLGLLKAGWYPVLAGQLYSAMPGQSGTVLSVSNVTGLFGALLPLAIGLVAEQAGLEVAIWLLMIGPIALLIGLPRTSRIGHEAAQMEQAGEG